jgi:predicted NBD/HSP70 family sugar kinase
VNLGWNDLPLKDMLTARFEEPVFLANDSQAAALGEFMFGGPRESSNLLLIRLGKGIGAGIVLNNKLYYGDGFGAGEIGHVVLGESAGDTLEARVSSVTLLRQARAIAGADLSWDAFVDAVLNDDPALTEIVQSASDSLGMMVANLIAAFNIHNIVLSGPVSMFGDTLLDRTYQSAARRTLPLLAEKTTLISSSLGDDLVILGCSALVLQQELGVI